MNRDIDCFVIAMLACCVAAPMALGQSGGLPLALPVTEPPRGAAEEGDPRADPPGHLAQSVDEWVASVKSGQPKRLAPGRHEVNAPIEVDAGEQWQGCGRQTVLVAGPQLHDAENPGAVFLSKGYDEHRQAGHSWSHDGVPMAPTICDLAIDGGGDVNDQPRKWQADAPDTCHGIKLYCGGATVRNVLIYNVAGDALRVWRAHRPRIGPELIYDFPENRIDSVHVHKCFAGAILGGADGIVESFTAATIRDTALDVVGASYSVRTAHVYGCDTGVVFGSGGRNYGGEIIVENCGVGFINRSASSKVDFLQAYENSRADALLERKCRIVDCDIRVANDTGVLVTGSDCWISGEVIPRGHVGVTLRHAKARLVLTGFGNGTLVDATHPRAAIGLYADLTAGGSGMVAIKGAKPQRVYRYAGAE